MDRNSLSSLHPAKYKFLRKAIHVNTTRYETPQLLAYTKLKNIYLSQLKETYISEDLRGQFYYSKGKLLNCLTHLDTVLIDEARCKYLIKRSRNLKNVKIFLQEDSSLSSMNRCIKKLPNNIKSIDISGLYVQGKPRDRQELYKNLSACRNVHDIKMAIGYHHSSGNSQAKNEYDFMNQYCSRLRGLREFSRKEFDDGIGLQKFTSKGRRCPYLTSLLTRWEQHIPEADWNLGQGDEEYRRIPPQFRFEIFPNLRQLELNISTEEEAEPSMIEGFKSLKQLEQLTLNVYCNLRNLKNLLKGLFYVPLLTHFSILIFDVSRDDQQLLIDFMHKQTQLIWLSLKIHAVNYSKEQFEEDGHFLDLICQSLNGKHSLKYLCIDATIWSIEQLSTGLRQVEMRNQLKELEIRVIDDDILELSAAPVSKIEGFCEFIKRQKQSLTSLKVGIGFVIGDEIVNNLIRAIGEVDKLQLFGLEVNTRGPYCSQKYNKIVQEKLKMGYPLSQETFVHLVQTLPKLIEIADLTLNLRPIVFSDDLPELNTSVIFNVLPALKNLGSLHLRLPSMKKSIMAHPTQASLLLKCKNLTNIFIRTCHEKAGAELGEIIDEIEEILEHKKIQQFIKSNLTFNLNC